MCGNTIPDHEEERLLARAPSGPQRRGESGELSVKKPVWFLGFNMVKCYINLSFGHKRLILEAFLGFAGLGSGEDGQTALFPNLAFLSLSYAPMSVSQVLSSKIRFFIDEWRWWTSSRRDRSA